MLKEKETKQKGVKPMPVPNSKDIPEEILMDFLEDKVKVSQVKNITQIKAVYLWELGNIQRYRINIWVKEQLDGAFCHRHYIGKNSWFVQYHVKEQMIIDKTVAPKEKENKSIFS